MNQFLSRQKPTSPFRQAARTLIEPLELRQLLSASVSILVNGQTPASTINFGTVSQNSNNTGQPTKTITIKNTGDVEETGDFDLGDDLDTFDITAASSNTTENSSQSYSFDLKPGDTASLTVGLRTADVGIKTGDSVSIDFSPDDSLSTQLNLTGEVDAPVKNYTGLGTVGNGTITKTGQIAASEVLDNEGTVVEQVSDQLYGFQVTTQTTLGLALSASFPDTNPQDGMSATLYPDQSNGSSGQLTIAERNAVIGTPLGASDSGAGTGTATPESFNLGAGYYFIYLSASGVSVGNDDGSNPTPETINYSLKATIQQAVPAQLKVTGNGVAITTSNSSSPATNDGTSFGSVLAGTSESLSFTVSNPGGSALTIGGSRPDVSGDFLTTSVLPSSIAAGGSATFTIVPSSTTAGAKSGIVSISTNVGTFTFDVGGTYNSPVAPAAISVKGDGVAIISGDTSPSTADGTSFGTVAAGTAETLTFTVQNTGGSALAITGTEPTMTGNFSVASTLPSSIAAGGSATFSVTPISTAAGTDSGVVTIQTSLGAYTFDVGGTYSAPTSSNPPTSEPSVLTATVSAKKLLKGSSSYAFYVTYTDNAGIDLASLDNRNVLVKGPSGLVKWAKFISYAAPTNDGRTVTVDYHISPLVGSWTSGSNGLYRLYIHGTVLDSSGNDASIYDAGGNPDPLQIVGKFTVYIPA